MQFSIATKPAICSDSSEFECTFQAETLVVVRQKGTNDEPFRTGQKYIDKLVKTKESLDWAKLSCSVGGTLCGMSATIALIEAPVLIPLGVGLCAAGVEACHTWIEHKQNDIERTIDKVKEACSEGDEQCYGAILEAEGYKVSPSPSGAGGTTQDASGSSGTGAPAQGSPGPSSMDAERNPAGGGSVPCPKCTIKGSGGTPKPPKHEA
jgi:hypothetical protein